MNQTTPKAQSCRETVRRDPDVVSIPRLLAGRVRFSSTHPPTHASEDIRATLRGGYWQAACILRGRSGETDKSANERSDTWEANSPSTSELPNSRFRHGGECQHVVETEQYGSIARRHFDDVTFGLSIFIMLFLIASAIATDSRPSGRTTRPC